MDCASGKNVTAVSLAYDANSSRRHTRSFPASVASLMAAFRWANLPRTARTTLTRRHKDACRIIGDACANPFDSALFVTPGGMTARTYVDPSLSPIAVIPSKRAAAAHELASLPAATAMRPRTLALASQCADRRGSSAYLAPGKYIVANAGCFSHDVSKIFK